MTVVNSKNTPLNDNIGVQLIAAERQRQVAVEGFTPEDDLQHTAGQLTLAADSYLQSTDASIHAPVGVIPAQWPFPLYWYKPSTHIRNLVKAGALIAAELDRILNEADMAAAVVANSNVPEPAGHVTPVPESQKQMDLATGKDAMVADQKAKEAMVADKKAADVTQSKETAASGWKPAAPTK